MASVLVNGQRNWSLTSDDDKGHRTYKITHLVLSLALDGPNIIRNTPGLPLTGSIWSFDNDTDINAFCTPGRRITPLATKEPNRYWEIEQTFTTRPRTRCEDTEIEDPLLEPDKISGGFVKYTKEITQDKDGKSIKSSSHELLKGPQIEFDHNRPTVVIEQNVADLELEVFTEMIDTVNDATLWGLTARKIKLSNVSWERKYKGTCEAYYTRRLEFDIDFETFDREALDEGDKVINGKWDGDDWVTVDIGGVTPDPENPQHFMRAIDRAGNPMHILLNGGGFPLDLDAGTGTGDFPAQIDIKFYTESNFLLLGIPTSL